MLDLRRNGAMLAGTVAEISKTGNALSTWSWARYFYERRAVYGDVDGLLWLGAHNDGDCLVLFERAQMSLSCELCSVPLDHPALRSELLRVVRDHRLMLV